MFTAGMDAESVEQLELNRQEEGEKEEEMRSCLKLLRHVDTALEAVRFTSTSARVAATATNVKTSDSFPTPSFQPLFNRNAADKPRLVIFDKDGTLICFHEMWIPWATATAEKLFTGSGVNVIDDVYELLGFCPIQRRVGPGLLAEGTMGQIRNKLMSLLLKNNVQHAKAESLVEECITDSFKRSASNLRELHHLRQLFVELQRAYVKIAICTADNRDSTVMMLRQTGVEHLVDDVMCGDDLGSMPKPHPHNALVICKRLNIDPEDAVMVGDTVADMGLARSAGLRAAVGVLSGVGKREHLEPHADILLDHVGHLTTLFCQKSSL